jgi:hypothetical protein
MFCSLTLRDKPTSQLVWMFVRGKNLSGKDIKNVEIYTLANAEQFMLAH